MRPLIICFALLLSALESKEVSANENFVLFGTGVICPENAIQSNDKRPAPDTLKGTVQSLVGHPNFDVVTGVLEPATGMAFGMEIAYLGTLRSVDITVRINRPNFKGEIFQESYTSRLYKDKPSRYTYTIGSKPHAIVGPWQWQVIHRGDVVLTGTMEVARPSGDNATLEQCSAPPMS